MWMCGMFFSGKSFCSLGKEHHLSKISLPVCLLVVNGEYSANLYESQNSGNMLNYGHLKKKKQTLHQADNSSLKL